MDKRVRIKAGSVEALAELNDTATAQAIWDALPIESTSNTWGEEVYFSTPVSLSLDETAKEVVDMGDLGYWPTGRALCIFFGLTPMSRGDEIRPASAVNIVGKIIGDPKLFNEVRSGEKVRVRKGVS